MMVADGMWTGGVKGCVVAAEGLWAGEGCKAAVAVRRGGEGG